MGILKTALRLGDRHLFISGILKFIFAFNFDGNFLQNGNLIIKTEVKYFSYFLILSSTENNFISLSIRQGRKKKTICFGVVSVDT